MKNKLLFYLIFILFSVFTLIIVIFVSLCIGTTLIPLKKILYSVIFDRSSIEFSIIFNIRLPRIILGFAIGSGLSLSGAILQGIFRNPLVEPYTLGISGGAGLGVSLNVVFNLSAVFGIFSYPVSGFAGAACVILLIYFININKNNISINQMLLTGVMISFICSSLVMLILSLSKSEDIHSIIFWTMGSLDEPSWILIIAAVIFSVFGLIFSFFYSVKLTALSIGEENARHLGINVENTKHILFFVTSLLTGISVSVAGIIGFVGLVVPHFMRMIFGNDYRMLLISSFISGAVFLILCDTIARVIISPLELPVGVITGIIGGILFIYALSRKKVTI